MTPVTPPTESLGGAADVDAIMLLFDDTDGAGDGVGT
jgi:hypothetical protein